MSRMYAKSVCIYAVFIVRSRYDTDSGMPAQSTNMCQCLSLSNGSNNYSNVQCSVCSVHV